MALPKGPGDGVRVPPVAGVADQDRLHRDSGVESTVFELNQKPPVGVGSLGEDEDLEPLARGPGSITNGVGGLASGFGAASEKNG